MQQSFAELVRREWQRQLTEEQKSGQLKDWLERVKRKLTPVATADPVEELRALRLRQRIAELRAIAEGLKSRGGKIPEGLYTHLDQASEYAGQAQINLGWTLCNTALREFYAALETKPEELRGHAEKVRCEVREKLHGWRRDAALNVLRPVGPPGNDGPDKNGNESSAPLVLAKSILDEHFDNIYLKMDIVAERLRVWPAVLFLILSGLIVLAALFPTEPVPLSPEALLTIALVGALGAAISRALTVMSFAGRIPELLRKGTEWQLRLLVGAASAVGVVLLIQAGLLPEFPEDAVLGVSFVAGFSDQLLTKAIGKTLEKVK